jgi:hypothetical protein
VEPRVRIVGRGVRPVSAPVVVPVSCPRLLLVWLRRPRVLGSRLVPMGRVRGRTGSRVRGVRLGIVVRSMGGVGVRLGIVERGVIRALALALE